MGGEGSMSSANVSLKNNRSLVRKRKHKRAKSLLFTKSNKTKIEFKQISSEELKKIKLQIRSDAKKRAIRNYIMNVILITVITVLGYFIIFAMDGR